MTDIIKRCLSASVLGSVLEYTARLWRSSLIYAAFTKRTNDSLIENSRLYRVLFGLIQRLTAALSRFGGGLDSAMTQSAVLSGLLGAGQTFAERFRRSLLCGVIERVLECTPDFAGLRLYHIVVMLVVFAAPFLPTMICAYLALLSFLLFVIDAVRRKAQPKRLGTVRFMVLLLTLVFGFFAVFSLTAASSLKIWLIYAAFMLFLFPVVKTASSADRLYKLCAVMVLSGLVVAVYGIYQRYFGDNLGHAWLDKEMFTDISIRVYSTLGNPNVLGEYLLLVMPVCAALLWTRKTWLSRLFYLGVLGTMTVCMVFTQSRGCWLGLLLAAAVFAALVDRRLLLFGAAALFFLPFVLPDSIINRFASIGNTSDSSTSYRVFIWLGTLRMLADFGIYGIGLGSSAFNKIYPFYAYSDVNAPHAHNIYLQLLTETGVVGLGLFLLTMAAAMRRMLLSFVSDKRGFSGILAAGVLAAMLGFLLQGAFDYVWYNYRVFLVFWITLALGIASRRFESDKIDTCHQ